MGTMTVEVKLDEAKVRLRDLIEAAIRGEDVFILKDNKPAVRLVPIAPAKRNARFGSAKGLVSMSADFDAPLEDFGEYLP
jgi:prevent-host-death family protein